VAETRDAAHQRQEAEETEDEETQIQEVDAENAKLEEEVGQAVKKNSVTRCSFSFVLTDMMA